MYNVIINVRVLKKFETRYMGNLISVRWRKFELYVYYRENEK